MKSMYAFFGYLNLIADAFKIITFAFLIRII